jgi:hypothetical protein
MLKEKDISILLCYYNELIKKLNTNPTDADRLCLTALATKLNAAIQSDVTLLSSKTRTAIPSVEISDELKKLLDEQAETDANVIKNMYQSTTVLLFLLFLILLSLYNFL